jgi:hypothetical protein
LCRLPLAEARNRVKGRPKPGASEPLTRRRVQYAGEGWRALLRSPACKPVLVAYLPPATFAAIRPASPGLKPVIARVRPNVRLPSIRWRLASLILHARYAIFQEHAPSKKSVMSVTQGCNGHVHFKPLRGVSGVARLRGCETWRLRLTSVVPLRVSPRPSDSATAQSRGAAPPRRSQCVVRGGSVPCPECAG